MRFYCLLLALGFIALIVSVPVLAEGSNEHASVPGLRGNILPDAEASGREPPGYMHDFSADNPLVYKALPFFWLSADEESLPVYRRVPQRQELDQRRFYKNAIPAFDYAYLPGTHLNLTFDMWEVQVGFSQNLPLAGPDPGK